MFIWANPTLHAFIQLRAFMPPHNFRNIRRRIFRIRSHPLEYGHATPNAYCIPPGAHYEVQVSKCPAHR